MKTRTPAIAGLIASTLAFAPGAHADEPPPQQLVGWGYQEFDNSQMRGLASISAGSAATMGIRPDGTVVGWGYLYAFGNVAPYVASHLDPRSLRDAVQLAASDYHVIVLQRDRTVSIVGLPRTNQIPPPGLSGVQSISTNSGHSMAVLEGGNTIAWGDNSKGACSVPADLPPVASVDCGRWHSIALLRTGEVRAWGDNASGACTVPGGLTAVRQVAAGFACSAVVRDDGTVTAWGSNTDGQITVPPTLGPVSQISIARGGGTHMMALRVDGTVACWGRNSSAECAVPEGLGDVVQVSAGWGFSVALRANGVVESWGFSGNGQCGPGSGRAIRQVSAGAAHALSLFEDGTVRAWAMSSGFTGAATEVTTQTVPAGLNNVAFVATGRYHCIAGRQDGSVVCWGKNFNGQCSVPAGLTGVVAAAGGSAQTIALKGDGSLVGWGSDWISQPPPSALPAVKLVACNQRSGTVALDLAGTPIAWGSSTDLVKTSLPSDLTGLTQVALGADHGVAIRTDGTLACWGLNNKGQASPPPVSAAATQVAAGSQHSLALLADGSVSAWGWNQDGVNQAIVPPYVHHASFVAAMGNSSFVVMDLQDCDHDDRWDAWQILHGEWDWNTNGLLDSCERSGGDLDMNGELNAADIALILLDFGPCDGCPTDLDGNGVVDAGDLALVMMAYGPVD
jgi:alpha-tubulin suppressor-like RCC1 family protein